VEIAKKFTGYEKATGDLFAIVAPIGIILGRIGCLLHGCCLGRVCEPHWWTLTDANGLSRWPAVPAEIAFNAVAVITFAMMRARRVLQDSFSTST
jgi:phosphatidylglycerol:prolipoprotein diacylglycerol transferase